MASYGRGIGNYGGRPDIGRGIGRGLSSLADRLREIDGQKIREQQIASQRAYETEREDLNFQRGEESALARELRQNAAEEARFARGEQSDIAREQRGVDRELAEQRRVTSGLGSALRQSVPGLNAISNADQTVAPGVFEDYEATNALIASGDPGLMRGALVDRTLEPGRQARERQDYEWRLRKEREINPPAPRAVPRPDTIMVGGLPYIVGANGVLQPMRLPDGSTPPVAGPTGRRPTAYDQQREAFARMSRAGATSLGDFETGEGETLSNVLGMQKPTIAQRVIDAVPFDAGNALLSDEYQRRESAAFQIADSYLRFTSGAAVPEPEVRRFARAFTPRPGDKPETLAKKREDRKLIVQIIEGAIDPAAGTAALQQRGYRVPQTTPNANEIDPDILEALGGP